MAKRTYNAIEELADAISDGRRPSCDYFEKTIDATAGHDRMLVGLYGLLAAGTTFLLFQVEMSPWAGAAMVTAGALFVVGLAHVSVAIVSYNEMLLLANEVDQEDETGDLEAGPEAFLRAEARAHSLHYSETHFLFLGLLCAGAAAITDHWQYAWRAFVILAGVFLLFLLLRSVPRIIIKAMTSDSGDATEDETRE